MNPAIKRFARNALMVMSLVTMLSAVPTLAHADDWGCQVLLCLANPGGPEPAAWLADLGAGTGASNMWAGSGYCREDLLYWGGPEESIPLCRASGAINVMIDGALYTRVWWGTGGVDGNSTITEYYGPPDLSGVPDQVAYDPTQAFARWMPAQDDDARWNR